MREEEGVNKLFVQYNVQYMSYKLHSIPVSPTSGLGMCLACTLNHALKTAW